jgi:hypothetical protein
MPAFVYSGMQYSRIASYYFAQVRKKLLLLRCAARARNNVPREKSPKNGAKLAKYGRVTGAQTREIYQV